MSPRCWSLVLLLGWMGSTTLYAAPNTNLFARTNLAAWCIVPFDAKKRGPEERAGMLQRLGFTKLAYDWRAEHVPTFEAEILALKKHNIEFFAFWDAQEDAFKLFEKYNLHPQIWKTSPSPNAPTQEAKVEAAGKQLLPLVERTRQLGCELGLYNHGGWGGEPDNLVAICEWLKAHTDAAHVGIVYNFHHGHDVIRIWPGVFRKIRPYLLCVNLNGMILDGDKVGHKILHLGEGTYELRMMRVLQDNGWEGPIGIIDHRPETDSEVTLRNNLRGLGWLVKELAKKGSGGAPPFPPVKVKATPVQAPQPTATQPKKGKKAASSSGTQLPTPSKWTAPGKFGSAMDPRLEAAGVPVKDEMLKAPFTVECWARTANSGRFNVFVSEDPKSSGDHWEIYSFSGQGDFSAYLPGYEPNTIRSGHVITDGEWHYLAMQFDGKQVKLFVDAKEVAARPVSRKADAKRVAGPLAVGTAYDGAASVGCDGLIDDLRISKGLRAIAAVPTKPLEKDADTLGLWDFNDVANVQFADASGRMGPLGMLTKYVQAATAKPVERDVRATGDPNDPSRQTESDWVDGRWADADIGQFLCSTVETPGLRTFKGISIKVGDHNEGTVCYDTDLMRMSAAWTGGFLKLNPARYGLIAAPKPDGDTQITGPKGPGWAKDGKFDDPREHKYGPLPKDWAHFEGMYVNGNRVVLKYKVGGVEVLESPWAGKVNGKAAFVRSFEIAPSQAQLMVNLMDVIGGELIGNVHDYANDPKRLQAHSIRKGEMISRILLTSDRCYLATGKGIRNIGGGRKEEWVSSFGIVPVHAETVRFSILTWSEPTGGDLEHLPNGAIPLIENYHNSLKPLLMPGPIHWQPLTTKGSVGTGKGPLLIDTLAVPYDNPWKALFFTSGLDFFENGDIAICTAHGDVWRVSGVDDKLEKLTWRRYATGLFQPLGLKIVDDVVHVLGRDQITRLHDNNGDGEADIYENFNNDMEVAGGGHSYATSLETDPQGNFWFMKCFEDTKHGGTIMRLAKDGSKLEVIATGFRNPNGMGMSPDGIVTAADNQGNWVPETRIDVVKPGGFYGFMPSHKRAIAPTDFDRPLLFVPRPLDNSAGGEAWIPKGEWGALGGQMIHFSFGRCTMMTVIRDMENEGAQGGVTALPGKFLSGVMRGRFNPRDKALYVTGLKGWQTSAIRDGCLQRVRYSGETMRLPTDFSIHENGIRLTFSVALDAELAKDVESYGIEQWNFRWSEKYGSPDFKPSQPGVEGRDTVKVKSARLLPDGKSIFIETEPLSPVMQFAVEYNLEDKDGERMRGGFYTTINRLGKAR